MPITNEHRMKRGDLLPSIAATLSYAGVGPIDLSNAASVKFIMRLPGVATPKVNRAAAFEDRVAGKVRYDWQGTDTDTAGRYHAEFEVTDSSGKKLTAPNDGYVWVTIVADLA